MSNQFPPSPPRETLRFEDGDLVVRPAELEDLEAIFALISDPSLSFMRDADRPLSLAQLRNSLTLAYQKDEAGEPTRGIYWAFEMDNQIIGLFTTRFDMLDKNGGTTGLLLRSATWQGYFGPDFINLGIARRIKFGAIEENVERALVRHFGVEQLIEWIDDANDSARAMVTGYGFEGPLHHDHPGGLGFYRRTTRSFPD